MFLHGYLSDANSFNRQIPFFGRHFNVFAFDLKGFGTNRDMEYPYSLSDYVSEVKEFAYKNSLKNPHVIAHSFGARVALKTAYSDSTFFDKMVLTGAAGLKPKFSIKKEIKKTEFNILKKFVKREKLFRFYSPDYNSLNDVMKKSFIKIVGENLDYTLNKIENEVLLVFGRNDAETPLYMAKRFNKGLKNSTLKIIDGAGHFCFLDKPNTFNWEVKEFLLS